MSNKLLSFSSFLFLEHHTFNCSKVYFSFHFSMQTQNILSFTTDGQYNGRQTIFFDQFSSVQVPYSLLSKIRTCSSLPHHFGLHAQDTSSLHNAWLVRPLDKQHVFSFSGYLRFKCCLPLFKVSDPTRLICMVRFHKLHIHCFHHCTKMPH